MEGKESQNASCVATCPPPWAQQNKCILVKSMGEDICIEKDHEP
jgi:hypothetical protein